MAILDLMSGRFEDIYERAGDRATLHPRKNDVLAEICRAIVNARAPREMVEDAVVRLQRYFGTASIGVYFTSGDRLELLGLSLPQHLEGHFAPLVRQRWGTIPSSSTLPAALAVRLSRRLRWSPESEDLDPDIREVLSEFGAGLLLAIPALVDGEAVGCVTVAMPEGTTLSGEDESLLADAVGMLGLFYRRTERREGELERERGALQAHHLARVGELAAGVAHEVNNPLSSITHLAELLLDDDELGEEARKAASAILSESRRAASTIQRLQSFVRSSRAAPGSIDLRELVEEVLGLMHRSLEIGDVRVSSCLAPDLPRVEGRRDALAGVVQNLLTNAREAAEETASPRLLRLQAWPVEGTVELVIEDTGPGFSDEVRAAALNPFFTTRAPGSGRGLGLSLSSAIAHELGGRIVLGNWGRPAVEGGKPGEGGARVVLRLPANSATSRPATAQAGTPSGAGTEPATLRVLVVEDEPAVALPLVKFLRRRGHEVDDVRSAEEALDLLRAGVVPDAIVSDIRMPGMGGQGFYEALETTHPELVERLVFVSGDVASPATESFLRATGRPYLAKPYPLMDLVRMLDRVGGAEQA